RSTERGFVLLSELQEIQQPEARPEDGWLEDAVERVRQSGMQLIDDVVDDLPENLEIESGHLTTDLVRQYLNDAGRHALLDKEDEANLAKRYQAGLEADRYLA